MAHTDGVSTALDLPPVSKSFGGNRVLNDVPMSLAAGEVRGLAGLNGSGKSTLVKLLAGYHHPDEPVTAIVDGQAFAVGNHDAAHEVGIRFVHQDLALIDALDSVDNVGIGAGYTKRRDRLIHWRQMRRHTADILDELGYSFDVTLPVERLTPSQRTGVAIARALSDWTAGSKIVVLDEPTATMPIAEVQNLFLAIDRMRSRGVAVVLVTHRLGEILTMADSVTILRNGNLVTTESVASMSHGRLVELMLGKEFLTEPRSATPTAVGPILLSADKIETDLIDEVDLEVRAGEVLGIAGLTGSGREDLLPAIFGTLPRGGEVRVLDRRLKPNRPPKGVDAGLGYVPAHRLRDGLFPDLDMTVNFTIANLASVTVNRLLNRAAERSAMQSWIEELGVIPADPNASVLAMSGGNQQKVVVGRWARPGGGVSVLLLDEPTQGVDVPARAAIYKALRTFAERGAVVISSSDTDELCQVCDRVLVMYGGRIATELAGDSLTETNVDSFSLGSQQGAA